MGDWICCGHLNSRRGGGRNLSDKEGGPWYCWGLQQTIIRIILLCYLNSLFQLFHQILYIYLKYGTWTTYNSQRRAHKRVMSLDSSSYFCVLHDAPIGCLYFNFYCFICIQLLVIKHCIFEWQILPRKLFYTYTLPDLLTLRA